METALQEPVLREQSAAGDREDADGLRRFVTEGDRKALAGLFVRHSDCAYRVALRVCGDASAAEDAVQTAFLHAMDAGAQFRHQSTVRSWIMSIVVNACRMNARAERARREREARVREENQPYERGESEEALKAALAQAVETLPEHYRLPVWLHYFEGLSFKEVAASLALPEKTVRTQAGRAIELLRETLATSGRTIQESALLALLPLIPLQAAPVTLTQALASLSLAAKASALAGSSAGAGASSLASVGGLAMKIGAVALLATAVTASVVVATRNPRSEDVAPPAKTPETEAAKTADVPEAPPAQPAAAPVPGDPKAMLGAADFVPSPEHPVGYRGDWTGRYPGATPPVTWSRIPAGAPGLAVSAKKPNGEPAKLERSYQLAPEHWLVLGFVEKKTFEDGMNDEFCSPEASPDEGEKSGTMTWKAAPDEQGLVCGGSIFGAVEGIEKAQQWEPWKFGARFMYAHTYIYCDRGIKATGRFHFNKGLAAWLNGERIVSPKKDGGSFTAKEMELKKGWNRLLVKVAGAEARWGFSCALHLNPPKSPTYETKNVLWSVPMPSSSHAQPMLVGDKLLVMTEPDTLLCFDKHDGKLLWAHAHPALLGLATQKKDDAGFQDKAKAAIEAFESVVLADAQDALKGGKGKDEELKKASGAVGALEAEHFPEMHKKFKSAWEQTQPGWACATPCSDGRFIYAWFQNGVAACYDLEGKRQWLAYIDFPGWTHHGFAASPILRDGKFIVEEGHMTAFDAKTGAVAWRSKGGGAWGSGTPAATAQGSLIINAAGKAVRVSDGTVLWSDGPFGNPCSAPIEGDGEIFDGVDKALELPKSLEPGKPKVRNLKVSELSDGGGQMAQAGISTGVYLDGLIYRVGSNGTFAVMDAKTGQQVYRKFLGLCPRLEHYISPGVMADLTLAGKYIYVFDDSGNAVVIQPGREFKEVARNQLLNFKDGTSEGAWRAPIFDGGRMYLRTDSMLYCIGEK